MIKLSLVKLRHKTQKVKTNDGLYGASHFKEEFWRKFADDKLLSKFFFRFSTIAMLKIFITRLKYLYRINSQTLKVAPLRGATLRVWVRK
jgi:hypothetical protein